MRPKRQGRVGPLRAAATLLAWGLATFAAAAPEAHDKTWRVLVLSGGDVYLPAAIRQDQALRSALTDRLAGRVEFRTEALDAVSFDLSDYEPEVLALLRQAP